MMDAILIEFLSKNALTLSLLIMLLKGIAKMTPFAWDDSLMSLIAGAVKTVRLKNGNKTSIPQRGNELRTDEL